LTLRPAIHRVEKPLQRKMRPAVELNHVCFSYGKSTLVLGKRKLYNEKFSKNIMKKGETLMQMIST
jgi:hypothetical protein